MTRPAVFLDRDGVIVKDDGYVHRPENLVLLPGVVSGLLRFQMAGYALVIVTNQSGIARGLFGEEDYHRFTEAMLESLSSNGVFFDAVRYCPHLPDPKKNNIYSIDCECRKPKPGMILSAIKELQIDISRSIMIGDRVTDLQAGHAAGVRYNYLIQKNSTPVSQYANGIFNNLERVASAHFNLVHHEHRR